MSDAMTETALLKAEKLAQALDAAISGGRGFISRGMACKARDELHACIVRETAALAREAGLREALGNLARMAEEATGTRGMWINPDETMTLNHAFDMLETRQ